MFQQEHVEAFRIMSLVTKINDINIKHFKYLIFISVIVCNMLFENLICNVFLQQFPKFSTKTRR